MSLKINFFSFPDIEQNKLRTNPQEINIHSFMAFSEIGRGREAMVMFTTIINMPPPMHKDNFDAINDKLYDAYMSGATESMKRAAFEVREIINPSNH